MSRKTFRPKREQVRNAEAMHRAPAMRSREIARLRSDAMTWAPEPLRMRQRSSSKVTSRTQCKRFSMDQ